MEGQNYETSSSSVSHERVPNLQPEKEELELFLKKKKKVPELQAMLKRRRLCPYGRKAVLVARLLMSLSSVDLLGDNKEGDCSTTKRNRSDEDGANKNKRKKRGDPCCNNTIPPRRKKRRPGISEDYLVPLVRNPNQEPATPEALTEALRHRWQRSSSRITHTKETASALTDGRRLTGVDVELLLLAVASHRPPVDPRFPLIGPVRMAMKNPFQNDDNNGRRTCYLTANRWDPDFAFIYMVVRGSDHYTGLFVARRKTERTLDVVSCDPLTGPRGPFARPEKLALDKLLVHLNRTEEGRPYLVRIHGEEFVLPGMQKSQDSTSDFCVGFLFPVLLKGQTVAVFMKEGTKGGGKDEDNGAIGPMEPDDPFGNKFVSAMRNTFPGYRIPNDGNKRNPHHGATSIHLGRALSDALEGHPSPGGLLRACHRVADAALAEELL